MRRWFPFLFHCIGYAVTISLLAILLSCSENLRRLISRGKKQTLQIETHLADLSHAMQLNTVQIPVSYIQTTKDALCPTLFHIDCPIVENKPLVIVSIAHNQEASCEDFLLSIFSQTYTNWELIYIDNGSTDATYSVAKTIIEASPCKNRVTLLRNATPEQKFVNLYRVCKNCAPEKVIVLLEDSQHTDNQLISKINKYYQNNSVWMTSGTATIGNSHKMSVLPTFYAGLFQQLQLSQLHSITDKNLLEPLLELAKSHTVFAPDLLYITPSCNTHPIHTDPPSHFNTFDPRIPCEYRTKDPIPLIVLSKNHPDHLKQALNSYQTHFTPLGKVIVYFETSNTKILEDYQHLATLYKNITFVQNSPKLKNIFVREGFLSFPLIAIASDELLLTKPLDGTLCNQHMQKHGASLFLAGYHPTSLKGKRVANNLSTLSIDELSSIPNLLEENAFFGIFLSSHLFKLFNTQPNLNKDFLRNYLKNNPLILAEEHSATLPIQALNILKWCE